MVDLPSPATHGLTWAPLSHTSLSQQRPGEDAQTQEVKEVNYARERRASSSDGTWLIPTLPLCSVLALAELYPLFNFQLPRLENEANNFHILNLEWKMEWDHGLEVLSWPWKEKKQEKSAEQIEAYVISRTSARGPQIRRWWISYLVELSSRFVDFITSHHLLSAHHQDWGLSSILRPSFQMPI